MIQRSSVTRYPYLDFLRALAITLVLWDHLFNVWPIQYGAILPHERLLRFIKEPLESYRTLAGWACVYFSSSAAF